MGLLWRTLWGVIAAMGVMVAGAGAAEKMVVRVSGLAPSGFYDASARAWRGLNVDLAKAVLTEAGIEPVFKVIPWRRALRQMESDSSPMLMVLLKNPQRQGFVHYVGRAYDEEMTLVVPQSSSYTIDSLDDFKALPGPVGVTNGVYLGAAFQQKVASDAAFAAKLDVRPRSDESIKKLNAGRLAAYVGDRNFEAYRIRTNPEFAGAKLHSFVIQRGELYFGVGKKGMPPALLDRLTRAYERLQASGEFDRIRARYSAVLRD